MTFVAYWGVWAIPPAGWKGGPAFWCTGEDGQPLRVPWGEANRLADEANDERARRQGWMYEAREHLT